MLIVPLEDFLLSSGKQLGTVAKGGKQLHAVLVVRQAKYWNTTSTGDTDAIILCYLLCLVTSDLNRMGVCELQH